MSKTAATTLVLLCSNRIVRMDFGPAPSRPLLYSWQIERPSDQAVGQAVEIALGAPSPRGKVVWVLCEELWTQTLALASQAVAGLSGGQLERVLSFEVESLSGLVSAESVVGFVRGPQEAAQETFWVTQISQADCRAIGQAVQRRGGRLRGICHPAGLPLPWHKPAEGSPWQRVEAWGEFALCMVGQPDGRVSSRFVSGTPAQESWRSAIAQWMAQSKAQRVEVFRGDRAFPVDAFDGLPELIHLPSLEGQGLEQWMRLWATALTEHPGRVPIIEPAARVVSRERCMGLAAAMGAVALALCLGHGYWMKHRLADVRAEIAQAQRPRQELTSLNQQVSSLEAQLKQLYKDRPVPVGDDPAGNVIRQKGRIPGLLRAMSQLVCDERVITRISPEGHGGVTMEGTCLKPDLADSLALGLTRAIGPAGWEVRGAQTSARLANADGGPWDFKVTLLPSAPSSPPASAASAAGASVKAGVAAGGAQ